MNIKNILPFENYILKTKLPVEEIRFRISENVEPQKGIFGRILRRPIKPYQGQVFADNFIISRTLTRGERTSFIPIITGHISTYLGTTQIKIKIRLHFLVILFCIFWLGAITIGVIMEIFKSKNILENGPSADLVIPLTMLLIACLLFTLPFKAEARKSKEFLKDLFEGEETSANNKS